MCHETNLITVGCSKFKVNSTWKFMKKINPSNVKFVNTLVQTRIIWLWIFHQSMKSRNRSNMTFVTFSNITSITFSRKSYLKRHIGSVHEEKKPFKRQIFKFLRFQNCDTKYHIVSVHEKKKTFKCFICNHISSLNNNLKKAY